MPRDVPLPEGLQPPSKLATLREFALPFDMLRFGLGGYHLIGALRGLVLAGCGCRLANFLGIGAPASDLAHLVIGRFPGLDGLLFVGFVAREG